LPQFCPQPTLPQRQGQAYARHGNTTTPQGWDYQKVLQFGSHAGQQLGPGAEPNRPLPHYKRQGTTPHSCRANVAVFRLGRSQIRGLATRAGGALTEPRDELGCGNSCVHSLARFFRRAFGGFSSAPKAHEICSEIGPSPLHSVRRPCMSALFSCTVVRQKAHAVSYENCRGMRSFFPFWSSLPRFSLPPAPRSVHQSRVRGSSPSLSAVCCRLSASLSTSHPITSHQYPC